MTKEEAKEILEEVKDLDDSMYQYISAYEEALDMAIKALSQEPCEDAVSRQAVKEQMIKYGFHAPDMTVTEFIEDLPSVLPKRERSDKE